MNQSYLKTGLWLNKSTDNVKLQCITIVLQKFQEGLGIWKKQRER